MKLKELLNEDGVLYQGQLGDLIDKVISVKGSKANNNASTYSSIMYALTNKITAEEFDKYSDFVLSEFGNDSEENLKNAENIKNVLLKKLEANN